MPSFAVRSDRLEEMEAPDVDPGALTRTLSDLARTNTLTLARPPTLAFLARATKGMGKGAAFTLLDVGYGHGDMLRAIHRWGVRRGLEPRLSGIDLTPASAEAATAATDPAWGIRYLTGDVFEHRPDEAIDFVVSSLVAHHMSDDLLVKFIGWMEANARRGWFINDLHRHPLAYYGFWALARGARLDGMVRRDGMTSVTRAFTRRDWDRLLAAAGIAREAEVRWRFPFRWGVARLK